MNNDDSTKLTPSKAGSTNETTKVVTFVVLAAYIALLSGFIVVGYDNRGAPEPSWFELIKLGFTTMGSALTLILGYYFGQREVLAVKDVKQEAERRIEALETDEARKRKDLMSLLNRGAVTSQPESIQAIDKASLPTGKPNKDGVE